MLHLTWPRSGAATACHCLRGARPYSYLRRDSRTLPDRPSYDSAPRGKTRTYDRRDKLRSSPKHRDAAVQQRLQSERNLRKRLVEGRLSLAEQADAAAAIEGLDLKEIAAGGSRDIKFTGGSDQYASSTTNADLESDGSQWPLLKRRQQNAEPESALENAKLYNETETTTTDTQKWPLLKRREPSYGYTEFVEMTADESTDVVATPVSTDLIAATQANLAQKGDSTAAKSHTMIRIDGLSTNVHASDFYRLADNELSKWNQSITKVQQVRDRMTLEPTGTYNVTFSSALAATAYAARFQRLHTLARIRANSRTGLWRSEALAALLPGGGAAAADTTTQEDLEAELARLSLAAGVHGVSLAHRRVSSGPESNKVRGLVAGDGLGERPPVVLIDVTPAAPLERVRAAVRQHGQRARGSWGLARAHPVAANMHQQLQRLSEQALAQRERLGNHPGATAAAADDGAGGPQQRRPAVEDAAHEDDGVEDGKYRLGAVLHKRDGLRRLARHLEGAALRRFVVAFRDRAEAQRFHRLWNGRWLGGRDVPPAAGAPRHFVRTQVLDY